MSKYNFTNEPINEWVNPSPRVIDVRNATPERNYCCGGAAREVNAIYEDVSFDEVVWQPDVYFEARKLADANGITRIIDVGCGNGEKLVHYFPENEFDTQGLDFHGSLSRCTANHPTRRWIECDLTSQDDLARLSGTLGAGDATILILSDVIEHLADPRPLIAWLRTLLLSNPKNRLVVSTPDRLRLGYSTSTSLPLNDAHIREWSLAEMVEYFECAGFEVVRSGHTRANQFDGAYSTAFVEVACSPEHYRAFLNGAGLFHGSAWPSHLLVTTEYAGFHSTGGIGSFVREQRETYGYENTLCLLATGREVQDLERLREAKLVSTFGLLDAVDIESLLVEDQLLKAVQHLLFYFPDLRAVHYADYQGIGCRIGQAKRAGMLPHSLQVIAHCHGVTHYLENAHQSWFGLTHMGVAEKEKISVECADVVVFPTDFLRALYAEVGIAVPDQRSVLLRYPYNAGALPAKPTAPIDTLIFYGKRSSMKGYDLFLRALADGYVDEWKAYGIKTITLIGPKVASTLENEKLLGMLRERFHVEEFTDLDRKQAIDAVHERAHRSVCVMPYLGDNHPYALLDVAFSTALPLMVRAGGVIEMFPAQFLDRLLANADVEDVRARLVHLLAMPLEALQALRTSFLSQMAESQESINDRVKAFPAPQQSQAPARLRGEVTVIVPVFNTPLHYLRDLAFGLNNQTYLPMEVIFVDDASDESYGEELKKIIAETLKVPHRVVRHDVNKGLAGARNSGVAATKTEFVINIDSDDVPRSDFVRDIVRTLTANPEHVAAVPYLSAFDDGSDFNVQRFGGYVYRPLGDGVIASQLDNLLGHANAGFRTVALREFGGWDESSKSMWEDWALYLKFASAGKKIAVVPNIGCLYRVRAESMLRTYKVWPAMRRLATNMRGLPRYESFRLQAMMRAYRETAASEAALTARNHAVELELNRVSVRVARGIANVLARHPVVFSPARACAQLAWRLAYKLRSIAKKHGPTTK